MIGDLVEGVRDMYKADDAETPEGVWESIQEANSCACWFKSRLCNAASEYWVLDGKATNEE